MVRFRVVDVNHLYVRHLAQLETKGLGSRRNRGDHLFRETLPMKRFLIGL